MPNNDTAAKSNRFIVLIYVDAIVVMLLLEAEPLYPSLVKKNYFSTFLHFSKIYFIYESPWIKSVGVLNLSKLQVKILSSYNTHSNQTTSIFIVTSQIELQPCIFKNYIKMTRRASSTISCQ